MSCFHTPDPVRRGFRCDGCNHNWYSAPGGQARKPAPHSRCTLLEADIPMVLGEHGAWLRSEVPPACPVVYPPPRRLAEPRSAA